MPQAVTLPDALAQAAELYRKGRWAEAEQLCRSILAARADQPDALYLLALIAAQTQRTPEAERLLADAIALRPNDPQLLANHATALKDLGRFDEALREYDVALRPGFAPAHCCRGSALHELGRFDEALQHHERAVALQPDHAEAYLARANLLMELGRSSAAAESHDRAISLRPERRHASAAARAPTPEPRGRALVRYRLVYEASGGGLHADLGALS